MGKLVTYFKIWLLLAKAHRVEPSLCIVGAGGRSGCIEFFVLPWDQHTQALRKHACMQQPETPGKTFLHLCAWPHPHLLGEQEQFDLSLLLAKAAAELLGVPVAPFLTYNSCSGAKSLGVLWVMRMCEPEQV